MPPEENAEPEAKGAEPELSEQPISEQELLDALGLDDNLQPKGASQGAEEKEPPPEKEEELDSASGDNAEEDVEVAEEEPPKEEESEEGETDQKAAEPEPEEKPPPKSEMQKRIDKLTRNNTTLAEQNKELEARLQAASPIVLQPTPKNPLSHLNTEKAVRDEMQQYRDMKNWCWKNLNGGELTDAQGNTHEVSGEDVRSRLSFAEDMILTHAPERITFLRERQHFDEIARKVYPSLFDTSSKDAKIAADFLQKVPELEATIPNCKLILGDAIRGMAARLAEQSGKSGSKTVGANGNKTPSGKPAPKLAPRAIKAGSVAPQKTAQTSASRARLEKEFMNTGDKKSLEAFILSTL